MPEPLHVYLNPVATGRTDEFEAFLREEVEPAIKQHRSDLVGRYRYAKSDPEPGDEGITTYVFILEGGVPEDDWDLVKLLEASMGTERAQQQVAAWGQTFAPVDRWLSVIGRRGDDSGQVGWTFLPVEV